MLEGDERRRVSVNISKCKKSIVHLNSNYSSSNVSNNYAAVD